MPRRAARHSATPRVRPVLLQLRGACAGEVPSERRARALRFAAARAADQGTHGCRGLLAARLDERIGRIAEKARLCLRSNPGDDGVAVLHGRSAAGGWSAFPMRASCATRPPLGPPQRRAVRAVSQCSRAVARVARLMPRPSDRRHPAVQRQRWSAPPTSLTALRLAGLRRPRSGARASF